MILGMTLSTFTLVHVVISLTGIGSGLLVMYGLLMGKRLDGATAIFLASTVATSVTGFGFPFDHLLPSHDVGILSLLVLAVAIIARYVFHLAAAWRGIYLVCAVVALYLNVFVLIIQSFLKVPALHAVAPGNPPAGPAFAVVQGVVLVFFIIVTVGAWRRYKPLPSFAC